MDMAKITDKIQALFNLAGNNPSEAEAKAALLKAQELIAKYNVDLEAVQQGSSAPVFKHDFALTGLKDHHHTIAVGAILANAFACKMLIQSHIVGFFGREDNAIAAAEALKFAQKVLITGQRRATRAAGVTPGRAGAAHYFNSYAEGFLDGLRDAIGAQTVALAVVVPQDVKDAMTERFPHLGTKRTGKQKAPIGLKAYNAGYSDGRQVMDRRSLKA